MARAGIHASLLLNGGAAVALLCFIGQLAAATETSKIDMNFSLVRWALSAFGAGVFLAASTNMITYFISSLRIYDTVLARRVRHETIDRLRWFAIAIFVASLVLFLLGLLAAVLSVSPK